MINALTTTSALVILFILDEPLFREVEIRRSIAPARSGTIPIRVSTSPTFVSV